jgi:c-di-GMP-binding flagellar brake protein YcgR
MEKADLYIERRKFKRVDKKCRVNYKVIMADEEAEEIKKTSSKMEGESFDLSLGGIKAEGSINGNSGDIIRLEVSVDGRPEPITTFAEIKWVKGEGDRKTFGLEFLILKDADRALIEEIIG